MINTAVVNELQPEDKVIEYGLRSLVYSVGIDAVSILLMSKYGAEFQKSPNIKVLTGYIENSTDNELIINDLQQIKMCISNVHEETFIEACRKLGVTFDFNSPLKVVAVKCLLLVPEQFERYVILSSVNKEQGFDAFRGKEIEQPVELTDEHTTGISTVLHTLIESEEPNRIFVVEIEQIKAEIILTAYFQQRTRTFTTISNGKQIRTQSITPATKAQAKYNTKENRIDVKTGNSQKIKKYLLESFGQVFFKDNTHFSGENAQIYNLDNIKSEAFSISLDEELQEDLLSAVIIEETIRIPLEDQEITLTIKGKDTEKALEMLSTEMINLKAHPRDSVTIELTLKPAKDTDKPKKVKVSVSSNSKISYDIRYMELVHKCLTKWGIQLANG